MGEYHAPRWYVDVVDMVDAFYLVLCLGETDLSLCSLRSKTYSRPRGLVAPAYVWEKLLISQEFTQLLADRDKSCGTQHSGNSGGYALITFQPDNVKR